LSGKEEEITAILQSQIEVEKKTLDRISRLENDAGEVVVRLAFMDLRLDTWKHIKFLEGMIEHLNTVPCDEWSAKVGRYAGRVKLERELEALISEEAEMIRLLEMALPKVNDSIAKLLLEHLKEEETDHKTDLRQLVKLIKQTPLQTKKGQKATDIVCDTD
jgi:sulfur relay (sulfurtransferase) DsrC/TusE family protein